MFNNINVKNLIFDVCNQTFDTHKPINSIESNNNIIIDELCFNKMTDINYKQNINSNEQTSVRGNRSLPLIPSDTNKEIKMSTLNFNNSSSICSSNTSIPAENAGDPDSNSAQNFSSKLENVTEWLNKSFDHSKSNLEPASKSPNHLLVQRQQRSNSIAHTRVISDEPFIEINLNKSFYQTKSSAQKEIDSKLKTRYSKSQTHMVDSEPELKNITPTRKCSLSPHNFRFDKKDQFEDLDLPKPKLEQTRNKKDETAGTISAEMAENLKNVHPNSTESIQKPLENRTNFSNEDDEVGPLNIKYQQCKNTKSASKITRSNEGRGFRELSVKRKEAVSNRDMVITDPALLYSLVQKQSINSNCQIPTNNLDNGTYLNSDKIDSSSRRASNHSPIFLEQFSPDNGLYGKQNEQTESNCDQMINLARFRSSSPYRKNSNTDSSESCNNQKQTDVRIRVNSNDFEKLKFDEMHGISNAEDSESVASINYTPKPSSNAGECKSLLNPEEINNSSEKKANSNSFIKHSQIDNDMHLFGDLQIQLSHSEKDQQIIVKILQARNLIAKDANGYSDPFVKVYLLPGREQENKRRTKHVSKNLNPEWNCTVIYPNVHREELKYKTLELTIWDWDRFKSNDFLGIVKIDLNDSSVLNDKPTWYKIKNTTLNLDNNVQEWRKSKETKSASSSFKRKSFKIKRN